MTARKQFLLRIDPALWRDLEQWAADDLRSVNAQVEWLLREAVRRRKGARAATASEQAARLAAQSPRPHTRYVKPGRSGQRRSKA